MNKTILIFSLFVLSFSALAKSKPNVIIIFTDDQGYEDVGVYGSPLISTPNLDKMANDGIRFTDFYVASSVCSASRAALLSGQRAALNGVNGVFWPGQPGMQPRVWTIAEMLKPHGYATAAFGKWHLGDQPKTRPTGQGFDEYYGIPYSNDMFPHFTHKAAKNIQFNFGYTLEKFEQDKLHVKKHFKNKQKLKKDLNFASPVFEGNEVVEYPADQTLLTEKYFSRAKKFIREHKDEPFFIFLTPAMPHIPLFASERFKGKSKRGLYGDTIEEIDYEVGQLRAQLKDLKLDKNTLLVFASDNGPWKSFKDHAGSAGPFKEGKFTNYEGGLRVPAIMAWPETIPAGNTSKQVASTMDLFPTIAEFAGITLPSDYHLDGQSIVTHLTNPNKSIDRDVHFYNFKGDIAGVRKGSWKYLRAGMASRQKRNNSEIALLFNLDKDISEQHNLAKEMPQKVIEMEEIVKAFEKTL